MQSRLSYQRSLVNSYHTSDLYRPHARTRRPSAYSDSRTFTLTRSGAGVDLPGFGRSSSDMSDQEDDAPAARNVCVVPDLVRASFLHVKTSAANVSGADPNFLLPTTLHGHAARSSRTKTFPVTSTASFCSSAFNFVGFSREAHSRTCHPN